ncbi:MAG TPA: hypothetical protein PLP29_11105 [Candidatus Ozemobacteraceae bacterium]|nr:hypothetical protein [Candidatus Ozemobacteraceae bacterium]
MKPFPTRETGLPPRAPFRLRFVAAAVLALHLVLPGPSLPCDDTILTLITGQNPADEFTGALLVLVRDLQKMASALTAYDEESARKLMETAMAGWLEFTVRYRPSPPPRWDKDPRWISRIDQISELLGNLRRHFVSGRPQASHDMIEGIATQMTLMGTRATGNEAYDPALEAEWELLGLNPSLPENASCTALLERLAGFSSTIRRLLPSLPQHLAAAHGAVEKRIAEFHQICGSSAGMNTPRPIRAYADLLSDFTTLRSSLWAGKTASPSAPAALPGQ